jgi:hypothetical protein
MTTFPNSPRLVKGGIVLLDPDTGHVRRIISLQYNSDTLNRTLQVQAVKEGGGQRSEPLRLIGPAVESIRLDAEIDATDQLEFPDDNPNAATHGIFPQLAALETLLYPASAALQANNALAAAGTLEIAPLEQPLSLFIWSRNRILPVRVTDFSITEEAFDAALNPIRAKVSLGLRVLTIDDVGFAHRAGGLFMSYLQVKEQLAAKAPSGALGAFGIEGLP